MKQMAGTWEKIKSVPGFIMAIIAIITAFVGAAAWAHRYFSAKHYVDTNIDSTKQIIASTNRSVDFIKCYLYATEDSLSAQITSASEYDLYHIAKNIVVELETKLLNASTDEEKAGIRAKIDEASKTRESHWTKKDEALKESNAAIERQKKCQV